MQHFLSALAIVATLATAPAPAPARDPEVLRRNAPWNVHYDTDACYLTAAFGEADDRVFLRLTRIDWGDGFQATLYGARFRAPAPHLRTVRAQFGGLGAPVERNAIYGDAGDRHIVIVPGLRLDNRPSEAGEPDVPPPPVTPEQEAAIDFAVFEGTHWGTLRFEFGSLGPPMAAVRTCMRDLFRRWGYDPDAVIGLSRRVRPATDPGSWFRFDDYPDAAMRQRASGLITFRLDVDPQGAVVGCTVLDRSEPDLFADRTCAILRERAALEPALDAAGDPVRSFYVGRVQWQMGPGLGRERLRPRQ